jgi:hypothetical protein
MVNDAAGPPIHVGAQSERAFDIGGLGRVDPGSMERPARDRAWRNGVAGALYPHITIRSNRRRVPGSASVVTPRFAASACCGACANQSLSVASRYYPLSMTATQCAKRAYLHASTPVRWRRLRGIGAGLDARRVRTCGTSSASPVKLHHGRELALANFQPNLPHRLFQASLPYPARPVTQPSRSPPDGVAGIAVFVRVAALLAVLLVL